jgi:hypothetical protein
VDGACVRALALWTGATGETGETTACCVGGWLSGRERGCSVGVGCAVAAAAATPRGPCIAVASQVARLKGRRKPGGVQGGVGVGRGVLLAVRAAFDMRAGVPQDHVLASNSPRLPASANITPRHTARQTQTQHSNNVRTRQLSRRRPWRWT